MPYWFNNKVVLITGAASGIGNAMMRRFAQEGASVCGTDADADGLGETVAQVKAAGGTAFGFPGDIRSPEENQAVVREVVKRWGRIDAACLNAGRMEIVSPLADDEGLASFDGTMTVNVRGTLLGLRALQDSLAPGGAVIVTASAAALRGLSIAPAYAASKHALLGLVRSLAEPFADRGCRINALCPGGVLTPMIGASGAPEIVPPEHLPPAAFCGLLRPQHVAEVALFLASSRAAGINGAAIPVDAGLITAMVPAALDTAGSEH